MGSFGVLFRAVLRNDFVFPTLFAVGDSTFPPPLRSRFVLYVVWLNMRHGPGVGIYWKACQENERGEGKGCIRHKNADKWRGTSSELVHIGKRCGQVSRETGMPLVLILSRSGDFRGKRAEKK